MTTELGRMALSAFELDTPETPKVGFGRIRGSKPQMARTMAVPSCADDEAGFAIAGNVRTRGVNPLMTGRPFS